MKKATTSTRTEPSVASLREMPEVDFARYRIRRNPYASVIAKKGALVVHDGPSPTSLAELPEADFSRVQPRRSSYADRARHALLQLKAGRGRPKRGQEIGPTPARSIRLPTTVWEALEAAARDANTTVHALLRLAVTHLLETPPFGEHLIAAEDTRRRRRRRIDVVSGAGRTATPRYRSTRARPRS